MTDDLRAPIPRTVDVPLGEVPLTAVHDGHGEGASTRSLAMALDVVVFGLFVVLLPRPAVGLYAVLALLGLGGFGVYADRLMPRVSDDMPRLLAAVAVPAVVLPWITSDAMLGQLMMRIPALLLVLIGGRSALYWTLPRTRAAGRGRERVLIVGAGDHGRELARILGQRPGFGLDLVGFIDEAATTPLPHPLLGGTEDLAELVAVHGVDRVLVAEWQVEDDGISRIVRNCAALRVSVHIIPQLLSLGTGPTGPPTDWLWTIPLVRLSRTPQLTRAWQFKRAMDVAVAAMLTVLTAPLWLAAMLAVRLSGPGPVLFRQVRVTEGGRLFEILKFRTMPLNDASDTRWGEGGQEPTPAGLILRRTGLDELPQLINILKGEMSLVGPRPERPHFVERFSGSIAGYRERLRVPAGLTGWAQVHGLRGETSIEDRVKFDNEYIERWTMWRDVVILVRTVRCFVSTRAPSRAGSP